MLCPNGTVKPFLVSLVEPVAYLKSELAAKQRDELTEEIQLAAEVQQNILPRSILASNLQYECTDSSTSLTERLAW
jgi:hypothetical protein